MSTEFYFPSQTSRRWLRVGPLAGDLDGLAMRLKTQGYARPSAVSMRPARFRPEDDVLAFLNSL